MQIPVEVSFRNMDRSEYVEVEVRNQVAKLEEFSDRITSCRVVVEMPHRHQHHGNLYHIRIQLGVLHRELVVDRASAEKHAHEDVYVAVRDGFKAMRRQLEDYVREVRGDTKVHVEQPYGRIVQFSLERGYGTILTPDDREIYFHMNSVLDADVQHLRIGDEVRFTEEQGDKGPQAASVTHVGRHHHLGFVS